VSSWFRHRSFQAHLSSLVAVAVGVAVALAALAAYFAVSNQLYSGVRDTLDADIERCLSGGGAFHSAALLEAYHNQALVGVFTAAGAQVPVPEPSSGAPVIFPNAPRPTAAQLAETTHPGVVTFTTESISGSLYRVAAASFSYIDGSGAPAGAVLLIAQPIGPTIATLHHLRIVLALVVLLGIGIAVVLGSLVALTTIRPVKRLTAAVEHVTATQSLDTSIDDDGRDDELGRLARAFNQMLAALRVSRRQQAQLVSDAGHELRTPLTSLRTNIEFLLRAHDMPEPDRAALLADVQSQLEEMTALVGDIVDSARHEERGERELTEVRLDAVLDRALERARRRAPSLRFAVEETPGSVRAQPALLERAVLNVLDNAAKWSPPGGTVEVSLRRLEQWRLEVRDHGPGIAPEDLPRVFDRFYRAPSARAMPGSGLGLAIVHQVVTEHGGTVEVEAAAGGGTRVVICLPTVEEDEPVPAAGAPWEPGGSDLGPAAGRRSFPDGSPAPLLPSPATTSGAEGSVAAGPGGVGRRPSPAGTEVPPERAPAGVASEPTRPSVVVPPPPPPPPPPLPARG